MAQAAMPARGASTLHFGRFGLAVVLVVVAIVAGLVGYFVAENRTGPADPNQALLDDSSAAWSGPYDAALVAATYAQNATVRDTIGGSTMYGRPDIETMIQSYIADYDFKVTPASTPVQYGDYVAAFVRYGSATASAEELGTALTLFEIKDGKIQNQWIYPAE